MLIIKSIYLTCSCHLKVENNFVFIFGGFGMFGYNISRMTNMGVKNKNYGYILG